MQLARCLVERRLRLLRRQREHVSIFEQLGVATATLALPPTQPVEGVRAQA